MLSTTQALNVVLQQATPCTIEYVPHVYAIGRVLREDLEADRDFPPFDRVTMDGIALRHQDHEAGRRHFAIAAVQGAGKPPVVCPPEMCVEVMTGAVMPLGADTVIRYEDLEMAEGVASYGEMLVKKGQNVHKKGQDRRIGSVLLKKGICLGPAEAGIISSIGKTSVAVSVLPRIAVISTGDELVEVNANPLPHQIRRSNVYSIAAMLKQKAGIKSDLYHFQDNRQEMETTLAQLLTQYDALIFSGAVSEGKFDHLPLVLQNLGVECLFHKVAQRPGKPFWFGKKDACTVFALPGNPVSTFVCTLYYVLPWINATTGQLQKPQWRAVLDQDLSFNPALTWFIPVQTKMDQLGRIQAAPVQFQGSGDLNSLHEANAFLELPPERNTFERGEVFPLHPFNP